MSLENVLAKLANVEPRGRGYIADCPLHPSKPAFLRITVEYGHILLDCPEYCPDHEIAAAIGLTTSDLTNFDDASVFGKNDHPSDAEDSPKDDDDEEEPDIPPENFFEVKPAAHWLAASSVRPTPRRLFGEFWLEGELCILFADTGKGKSILAVQIADSLSRGVPIAPFDLDVPAQKVLYFDFELSDKMFESRYSLRSGETGALTSLYPFSLDFLRAQVSSRPYIPGGYETLSEYIHESFDQQILRSGARLLIIDNITFLNHTSNENSARALRLIAELQRFKHEYGLSILALAHTPKHRFSRGLNVNDLQGSKMLSNFCDNIFAIGESMLGGHIRYLKHIKPRNTELIYGASNVCTYRIEKESDFLCFRFMGYSHEREHLENITLENDVQRRILAARVRELHDSGMTQRDIASHLGISVATVNRYLKKK